MEALGTHVLQALQLGLWLAAPALLASVAAGLLSGLLQAVTQIQDAALGFVPRLLAAAVALALSATWMSTQLVTFTRQLWQQLALLAS